MSEHEYKVGDRVALSKHVCEEGVPDAEIRETKLRLEYHNYRLRTQVEIAELREEIFKLKEDLERSKRG